eukprot:s1452_g14.t1
MPNLPDFQNILGQGENKSTCRRTEELVVSRVICCDAAVALGWGRKKNSDEFVGEGKVDIMQQCVNLQLETGHNHHEVGDTDAYREVIADAGHTACGEMGGMIIPLRQGMPAWTVLDEEVQQGMIHRVNREDEHGQDFQYTKTVKEAGKSVSKVFIVKDRRRDQLQTRQLLVKGDPAGGKTTFAKQLLTWIMRSDDKWLVPVMVRTIDLVRSHDQLDHENLVMQYLAMVYKDQSQKMRGTSGRASVENSSTTRERTTCTNALARDRFSLYGILREQDAESDRESASVLGRYLLRLGALVDTALLEDKVKGILIPLVSNRQANWIRLQEEAAQAMDDLAVYFSGQHALKRKVRNEELEEFFRSLQQRIEELSLSSQEDVAALGRKVSQVDKALDEVAFFHEVSQQPQILHFLSDARQLLQRMLRTANLNEEMLGTIETVADLSYAWHALAGYKEAMGNLLATSPESVKGLRALFLKLASILEVPLRRIRQSGNESHASLVSNYYSAGLVQFMRSVLQDIPRLIFQILAQLATLNASVSPVAWPSRISFAELHSYAQRSESASIEVGKLTQRIALLMRGIRETDVAVLGAILVEPKEVLVDGLRRELAANIEAMLAKQSFDHLEASLKDLADQSRRLRGSFEHVQDYLGVSAQELWRAQFGRVVRFLLHMEQHQLLGKRGRAKSSPDHDPSQPIRFPDGKSSGGSSFLSRCMAKLLELTEPKSCSGGFRQDWCSSGGALDSLVLQQLMEAVASPGIAAMSKLLALKAAGRVRKVLQGCTALLGDPEHSRAVLKASRARSSEALRACAASLASQVGPLASVLSSLGQIMLLQRRLTALLRLHGSLDAPLINKSLGVLDGTALVESLEEDAETEVDGELPSLWDFVDSSSMAKEGQLRFRRKLAKTGELHGFAEPLRQLLLVIPEDSAPNGLDTLLALALVQYVAEKQRQAPSARRTSTWTAKAPAPTVGTEAHVALSAGLASFLQQLPRQQLHGTFQVCGFFIQGLCSEEGWAEGALIIQILQNCLELLGFPREHLAEFVPVGLLELWPAE